MTFSEPTGASPSLRLDDALIAALRGDLTAAGWTASGVEKLLSPMALAAMQRDQFVPAGMELERVESPAAVLTRLFMLAEPVASEAVERALPSLGIAGTAALGLVKEASDGSAMITAAVDLRPHAAESTDSFEGVAGDSRGIAGDSRGIAGDSREIAADSSTAAGDSSMESLDGPHHWWVASDLSQAQTGEPPREDFVLGIASASKNLARLTLRDPIDSALDLGCGCGILALQLTSHAKRVVATDISERACNFTRFNALLNGVSIDVRQGSFFEPVAGERFDLITSNPPFVITPRAARGEGTLEYRDGGLDRDQLIPLVIKQAVRHLAAGGTLQMLANWEVRGNEFAWEARPKRWIEHAAEAAAGQGRSVDAWLVQRDLLDVAQYAEWWIRDGLGARVAPARWRDEYRMWMQDFQGAGTRFVGLGSLALRVRDAAEGSACTERANIVCEYLPEGQPVDALAVRTALGNLSLPAGWANVPLVRAPDVREVRYFVPGSANPELIQLTQGRAGGRERSVTSAVAALIGVSDGELAPERVVPAIAMLLEESEEAVRAEIEAALPELLRSGVAQFGLTPSA